MGTLLVQSNGVEAGSKNTQPGRNDNGLTSEEIYKYEGTPWVLNNEVQTKNTL